ncbi:hypothetical protein [Roseateles oligotrophus]|uniref:Uncharacterized protein n=1 Tax=Roseateles oligotrophus TaxID=1769250 RepID=A0ABT2YGE9_9BURK|nr:hypothetical protein [Roseateles oligotrophus]MCV2369128.1 hypothetical protein [Roseateles oligotrophus]
MTHPQLIATGRLRHRFVGLLVAAAIATIASRGAQAAEPITHFNVVLLQPSAVLEERVPSIDAMAAYVKAVEAAAREAVIASGVQQSVGGFIVVAVRPGLKSNVWLDFDAMLDLGLKQQIGTRVRAVAPFEAIKGPVVFALKVATWNGKESKRLAPAPLEWKQAPRAGGPLEVGELVESLWTD